MVQLSLNYDSWLLNFAVSVSFRTLLFHEDAVEQLKCSNKNIREIFEKASKSWANFLLGMKTVLGPYEHHCVILPLTFGGLGAEKKFDLFLRNDIAFLRPVIFSDRGIYVITKMCRLCIVGTIQRRADDWTNTRIAAKGGRIRKNQEWPPWLLWYLRYAFLLGERDCSRFRSIKKINFWKKGSGWDGIPND
jgi:hypothetical protein